MNKKKASHQFSVFQTTAIFSMLFALIGFSYNVWRMEITEYNSNMRSASFELLLQLSELEAIVYYAHYDKNPNDGNPRKGWIKVGLISDLSMITEPNVHDAAQALQKTWQANWSHMQQDETSAQAIIQEIDSVRLEVRKLITHLE